MDETQGGFPEWTELGQDSGLDPLGMQRPIEIIYQALIPGISTITLRYRYYAFFPLILRYYENDIRHADPDRFRNFQRRCEALFALISSYGDDPELGITGKNWATKQLAVHGVAASPERVIDFEVGADAKSDPGLRYIKNLGGAFGAIYATQMSQMGLVHFPEADQHNPNPVCSDLALQLAGALERELDGKAEQFFAAAERGRVSGRALGELKGLKPSKLRWGSAEHALLVEILLGRRSNEDDRNLMRRSSLLMLLRTVGKLGYIPHADAVKWDWFETPQPPHETGSVEVPGLWRLYQACDLLRLAYETILSAALSSLEAEAQGPMSLAALTEALVDFAGLPDGESWEAFSISRTVRPDAPAVRQCADAMMSAYWEGEIADQVRHAVLLVIALMQEESSLSDLSEMALRDTDYFQSLRTEAAFLSARRADSAHAVLSALIRDRIIKRHLWVASRKFRNQKAYTFLMEPEDGLLRYRDQFTVAVSSPRIIQALGFLRDVYLIDEQGITSAGQAELEAA